MARLNASNRTQTGSRANQKLRREGMIPGIVYGHGLDNLPITLSEHDIELSIQHGERLLEVDIDGKTENVLIRDVQYDVFGQDVLHVDLVRVNLDERVEVAVPIILRGTPVGTTEEEGVLSQIASEVNVECLVTKIPDEIVLPVHEMHLNDTKNFADLDLPEGAKLLDDPEMPVCAVQYVSEEEEVVEEEEGAESLQPEVVGEKPEEEEETEE
jgi:large subunit ribosomal protein L25